MSGNMIQPSLQIMGIQFWKHFNFS